MPGSSRNHASGRRIRAGAVLAIALWLMASSAVAQQRRDGSSRAPVPPQAGASTDSPNKAAGPARTNSLLKIFNDGGPLMYVIAACSVIAGAFSVERFIVLRRGRVIPKAFVTRFLHQLAEGKLDRAEALQLCRDNGSPVACVFGHTVAKWGRPSVEIEQAMVDGGEREVSHLRQNLRVLNGVASVAPLLGLLGTVFGMIMTFNELADNPQAMGKADRLAIGISVALLTTAAGLTVAIPALVAYLYFVGRAERLVNDIDALAHQVVETISAEGLEQPRASVRTKLPPPVNRAAAEAVARK